MASPEQSVPFVDLRRQHAPIAAELRRAVDRVIERGDFVLGEEVERFEGEFADHVGAGECAGVASGTAALHLALRALGVGPGDEVVVPGHTFAATALAVVHAGAEPVFCDVSETTGLIDPAAAEAACGPRTAAIVPVHLYGRVCDMGALLALAERRGIAIVEDAAQAHGASLDGRMAGSFGAAAAFSFYPSKNLGALGDGGAVCTSDPGLARRVRELRNLGQREKGLHAAAGLNERLDTLQAAALRVKLPHLTEWNRQRAAAADSYAERLPAHARTIPSREGAVDVHHLFPVRLPDRDAARERLARAGVATGLHYTPPAHRQPAFADGAPALPNAEAWAAEELSLPMFPGIRDDEVARVCEALA
jgi:dTDP-4-amino-4,6-dideoxygalactose transaminase